MGWPPLPRPQLLARPGRRVGGRLENTPCMSLCQHTTTVAPRGKTPDLKGGRHPGAAAALGAGPVEGAQPGLALWAVQLALYRAAHHAVGAPALPHPAQRLHKQAALLATAAAARIHRQPLLLVALAPAEGCSAGPLQMNRQAGR